MKIALDTNVLSYHLFTESGLSKTARLILEQTQQENDLIICPAVCAELAAIDDFDAELFGTALVETRMTMDWTLLEPALWLRAGFLYGQYARSLKPKKGSNHRILAHFLILAHSQARADLLLTFDNALVQVADDPRVVYAPDWTSA